ncbi:putative Kv channel-interacting protein 4-like isoform X2 [Penaeus vannamei]|uniref:Putative Kv channel-interacting protein 4-like isoform X2 n=1 Tax=Penaeus vannamei TaxID=6689 RepID=A0A423SVR7_PENVA|nr:putative Kv channel-interacting protein 4-like isoform X2 [Penaeus vannamei]
MDDLSLHVQRYRPEELDKLAKTTKDFKQVGSSLSSSFFFFSLPLSLSSLSLFLFLVLSLLLLLYLVLFLLPLLPSSLPRSFKLVGLLYFPLLFTIQLLTFSFAGYSLSSFLFIYHSSSSPPPFPSLPRGYKKVPLSPPSLPLAVLHFFINLISSSSFPPFLPLVLPLSCTGRQGGAGGGFAPFSLPNTFECPTGLIDEEGFKGIFSQFFPLGDATHYAHYVFNTFTQNNQGQISFEDFLAALSTVSRGTTQEKLQWIFGLYDVNNDGLITKTEMVDVVTAIYEMMGRSTEPQVEETSAKEHVEKIFHLIDTNQDGAITIEELAEWVSRDDTIIQSLSMMDTVLFTRRDRGADGAPPPTRPSLSQP